MNSCMLGMKISPFKVTSFKCGKFIDLSEKDILGHWSVLFFYPGDFSFVCPTEIKNLSDRYEDFKKQGIEIYAISQDTHFSHKIWHDSSPEVSGVKFYMVGDPAAKIIRNFNMMIEGEGLAVRGTFILDPEGCVTAYEIYHKNMRRSVNNIFRTAREAQYATKNLTNGCAH